MEKSIVTGVFLKGELIREIEIPKFKSKKELFKYLLKSKFFIEKFGNVVNNKKLGLFWRRKGLEKSRPQPCIIFRHSNGYYLKENKLCNKWRSEFKKDKPVRSTYGPVILLNIQEGKWDFCCTSYTFEDYNQQCIKNFLDEFE